MSSLVGDMFPKVCGCSRCRCSWDYQYTGYNGALSGFPHCDAHNDYQPCETSAHAERNAIDLVAPVEELRQKG